MADKLDISRRAVAKAIAKLRSEGMSRYSDKEKVHYIDTIWSLDIPEPSLMDFSIADFILDIN